MREPTFPNIGVPGHALGRRVDRTFHGRGIHNGDHTRPFYSGSGRTTIWILVKRKVGEKL